MLKKGILISLISSLSLSASVAATTFSKYVTAFEGSKGTGTTTATEGHNMGFDPFNQYGDVQWSETGEAVEIYPGYWVLPKEKIQPTGNQGTKTQGIRYEVLNQKTSPITDRNNDKQEGNTYTNNVQNSERSSNGITVRRNRSPLSQGNSSSNGSSSLSGLITNQ